MLIGLADLFSRHHGRGNPSPGSPTNASRPSPSAANLSILDLLDRFSRHIEASGLLEGAERVVVACSGGGDSTALLVILNCLSKNSPPGLPVSLSLAACHVAHGLRGKAGRKDALFVEKLSASLGIPFVLREVDVPANRKTGESLEAAGRRLRYEALLAVARANGPGTLAATGHTLDDQAETVLLNLHRHAGRTRGGIRAARADGVVRPLLPFSRDDLRVFLRARNVDWREDETNENEALLRNRIRRHELPALEAASPGTAARLARAAEAWSARLDALDARIDAALGAAHAPLAGPWPRPLVVSLGKEAAGRLLLRAAGISGDVPGRHQVEAAVRRLRRGEARFAESLAGRRLSADTRVVRLARRAASPAAPPDRLET
ncbi:MAG TPA: tRNA lysidine(34) synthetase TilS [Thermoanaerobaculia bacterium]|nr:tRNA lysidine(34) synthetase TilS [Thermoanaerobaculia bacterium]